MKFGRTLAFKLVGTGLSFLLLGLASITLTLWVTWQLEGGAAAVNEAGRVRMMSYRLALDGAAGNRAAMPAQIRTVDATLDLLGAGDPSRPLFVPWNATARAEFAALRAEWAGLRRAWSDGATQVATADVDRLVQRVDGFVSLIEQRLSYWTEVLRIFQLTMLALAIGSAVLLLYAMHVMVLDPLRRLEQGMETIRDGDFAARVEVTSADEFGRLASGFNLMAARLAALYRSLEAKVEEKTARLEHQRERLASLYEVSAFVAKAENLDELARGFVSMVRRIARADAVAVRWADDANQRYLMLTQEGLPPELVQEEQCLVSGECHCGLNASSASTRVIPIRSDVSGCSRAGFEMLLTVPVSLHHRVLGEIDLFYRGPQVLEDDDRSLIETLASHLAGGIESLRASAADREAAVAAERGLIAQELHDSIAQSLAFLKIQVELLRGALRRGDEPATQRTLAEIDAGVRESYGDVRELLMHFRTRTDREDIEAALRTTLQKFEHQSGLATELTFEGHGVPLPTDVQIQVLHVLQEALSNVRKHARATLVRVHVRQTPQWRFEVSDDGQGFDPAVRAGESHVGLRIMRERAQRIGAQLAIQSRPGAGTVVAITVPRVGASIEVHDERQSADSLAGG